MKLLEKFGGIHYNYNCSLVGAAGWFGFGRRWNLGLWRWMTRKCLEPKAVPVREEPEADMDVITTIFFSVFLNTVAGTSGLIFWFMMLPTLRKKGLEMVYFFLKLVLILYLFPLLPLVQLWKYNNNGERSMYGIVTLSNKTLYDVFTVGAVIWLIVVLILVLRRVWDYLKYRRIRKGDVPVEQTEAVDLFGRTCRELNLEGRVALSCNDHSPWPCLTGFWHPTVILPYRVYRTRELEMIFYHELIHYQNHELLYKLLTEVIKITHWFNLFAYCLLYLYEEWSETYCDMMTCRKGEKYFTKKEYFTMLLDQAEKEEDNPDPFNAFLLGDGSLERRTKRVMTYKKTKQMSKMVISFLMAVFLLASSVPAFAAGDVMLEAYEEVYFSTSNWNEEAVYFSTLNWNEEDGSTQNVMQEYVIEDVDLSALGDSVEIGEWENPDARSAYQINWEVAPDRLKRTYGFSASAGGTISILIDVYPTGGIIQVGIIDPDGDFRYVSGDGSVLFDHRFALTKTGTYYFFVRNLGPNDIEVVGTVGY